MNGHSSGEHLEGIAIIGFAGRFPGSRNVAEFWENLKQGKETITRFTDEQLAESEYDFPSIKRDPNYVRARGILDDIDKFDAAFFGYTPAEAAILDPQHRLFLECAWEALEHAGYDPDKFDGAVGVYGGCRMNTYLWHNLCHDRDRIERFIRGRSIDALPVLLSSDKDFLSTRVSYRLHLRGPSINVQTACSTSLVAVCLACQSLLSYECDMALAGGASILIPQEQGYLFREGRMDSPDGHCRAFDAEAQGTVFGNGVGIVVLKRLEDAVADRDYIYAVIKGSAINNDGHSKVSYTAPSVEGQAEVILTAQALAGIDPETITYVETHGTGTPLGDPIEIAALTKAFRSKTERKQFCGIGSVKTNVGHLEFASGVTSLIKTALSIKHGLIPPSLHFRTPNPEIDFPNTPFYVVTQLKEWVTPDTPRRAAVSSFGVGGTNAHVILEEPPEMEPVRISKPWHLLTLSAKTPAALDAAARNLSEHLKKHPDLNLGDVAYTLRMGRKDFELRRFLVCSSVAEAVAGLEKPDTHQAAAHTVAEGTGSVAFMFPGQGAQHVNMGRELYETEATFKSTIDYCSEILARHLGFDMRNILFPSPDQAQQAQTQIEHTVFAQLAIFMIEYALARLWMKWGVQPKTLVGHSIGEYVAACISGIFSLDDALELLAARARLMQEQPPGSMLSVPLPKEEVESLIGGGICLAAANAPSRYVLSGPTHLIEDLNLRLSKQGIVTQVLHTSHAFHSEMMEPVVEAFAEIAARIQINAPTIPIASTLTGTWLGTDQAVDPQYWANQLRYTVRFSEAVEELSRSSVNVFLEVGPGKTLTTLALQHDHIRTSKTVIASLSHVQEAKSDWECLQNALGKLWLAGCPIDWKSFFAADRLCRVPLPSYPFERRSYWIVPPKKLEGQTSIAGHTIVLSGGESAMLYEGETMKTPVSETSPSPSKPSGFDRRERILTECKSVLNELSGIDVTELDAGTTFLEMGFDSLFLTQVSLALQSRFQVKVNLRLLLEDTPSLSELADYLSTKLPPERFADSLPQATPISAETPTQVKAPTPSTQQSTTLQEAQLKPASVTEQGIAQGHQPFQPTSTVPNQSAAEHIIAQQLEIMRQQLAVLGISSPVLPGSPIGETVSPAAIPSDTSPPLSGEPTAMASSSLQPALQDVPAPSALQPQQFGPFKPLDRRKGIELSDKQQRHLNDLIERYVKKTSGSKKLTQKHRARFADPRSVAGFQQIWKEITYPIVSERSSGSKIWDVDGNEYIDLTMGFGTYLFGHSPAFVRKAIEEQLSKGMEIGPQSPIAGEIATMICTMTGMDRATFCNTGSEAVLGALRAARTVTGKNKVVMFSGDYHGIHDEVLVRANLIAGKRRSFPIAPGIPQEMVQNVIVLEYGDPQSLQIIRSEADQLAAVLVEPVQSRRPDLQPRDFLHSLRHLTEELGIALIFDEIVTGFRLHPKGAQEWYGIDADIATYGKIIGGGMPIGVIAGKSLYMDAFDGGMWQYGDSSSPEAGVTFFAGTFVRHPLAMAASLAVMKYLEESGPLLQQNLNERTEGFVKDLNKFFDEAGTSLHISHCGSIFYLTHGEDLKYFSLLFHHLRYHGVHIWEGRPCFLSTAHTDQDLEHMLWAFKKSVLEMQESGFLPASTLPSVSLGIDLTGPSMEPEKEGGVPVTEAQREIWLASRLSDTASCAFNESSLLRLKGPLDVQAMQKAIDRIIKRHEALRTTFSSDGEFQFVKPAVDIEIPFHDLSHLQESARNEHLSQVLQAEVQNPFDLQNGPLLRGQILKLEHNYHVLILTAHHIVCDGWSYDVMVRDLSTVYTMICDGVEDTRHLPMQITEYAKWQKSIQESPEVIAEEEYWLNQFRDSVPVLELQSDRPRPPMKSYRGARETRVLDESVYQKLKQASAKQGATLYSTLLAAFATLLYRLSGQEDLVIGILAAGQAIVGSHDLVGHCTNLLPLRLHVDGKRNFSEFLSEVKRLVLDAYEHQRVTFGKLINRLNLRRDPSRTPLVSVMFNVDPAIHGMKFKDLDVEFLANPRCAYQFDFGFNLVASAKMLYSECDYTTDLFDAETINRWLGHYHTLLTSIAENLDQPIDTISILHDSELHQILVEWNQTQADYPKEACIHQLFEIQAERLPEARAVVFENDSITYRELNERANQLAHYLRSRGVGKETFVGVYMERSIDMVVGLLGILKAGGTYLPLDPTFPKERLEFMLEDSAAPFVLTQEELLPWLPESKASTIVLDRESDAIAKNQIANLDNWTTSENLAYVMYTSGSTGKPKGVQIPHMAVVNFLLSMQKEPGFTERDILLSVTTLSFDISVLEIFLPLVTGGCTVLVSHDVACDGNLLAAHLTRCNATVMQATPVTWRILLEAGWKNSSGLKALIGGEALPRELCDHLLRQGVELWNMYGPTETTIWSTIKRLSLPLEKISIGKPIANTQVYVLDKDNLPVPIGIPGELHIGGDGLARGYLNRPELTAEKFIKNPFSSDGDSRIYKTGDLAVFLRDGNLECLGRTDFQAKIRGFRVEPGEVETLLNRHSAIKQSAVVVRPDPLGENQLVAYVVLKEHSELGATDLRQYLREKLPDYMVPSRLAFLEALPLTPNGKIDRKALPPLLEQRDNDLEHTFVAPSDTLEMQLTKIWESVLGIKPVGIKDNFFEIGGHSLIAARLFSKIEKLIGANLPLATLYQTPTIELLAQVIREGKWSAPWSSLVPINPGGSRPPVFFVHGAGGNVLLYRDLASHLGPDQPFYALQAQGLDGKHPAYTKFEDMAAHYLREVRTLQPEGPYYLGGYCLGGAIALEMAQQLKDSNQEVALIAMIETYNMHAGNRNLPFYYGLYHRIQNLKYHWDNLWLLGNRGKMEFLSTKAQVSMERMKMRIMTAFYNLARKVGIEKGKNYPHLSLTKINDQAHLDYVPKPYSGKITLFRPMKHYRGYDDYEFGWGEVARGGVEVHQLPVHPRGSLVEPFVRKLADELKQCLERAA